MDIDRELNSPSPRIRANPYPFYAQLRKMGPVLPFSRAMFGPGFLFTRYEEVFNSLKDPRWVNDRGNAVEGGGDYLNHWWIPRIVKLFQDNMAMKDEPDHRRLRNLVHKAFTPRMVESMTARMEQLVDELLDRAAKKPVVDLIGDLALPLPLTIISEMLGVSEEDREFFRRVMSRLFDEMSSGSITGVLLGYPSALRIERFLRELLRLRRKQPGDDLTSALVQAEESGDKLNEEELISMIFLLLFAGHETTVNLIGNGTLALLEHPDQLRKLYEHPELIDSAIEELLRYGNPVLLPAPRFAREDMEIQGHKIPKGSMMSVLIASANRDEAAFENADQLDIARNPNRHVAFGYGIHYCLGAPLARLEGRIAISKLVQRFPEMRLAIPREKLIWRKSSALRGMKALPLHLSPPARASVPEAA